ncbi:MAG TPA: FtsX-like permease family protein [Pyrinomonadaceae bacterium]|nr:FtsX-like permease family protein [Pyrinomonadaceae bacterium]
MQTTQFIKRSLGYYWQTNLVVVLGVAIAVSVLAGALLIGESVRGSLRDLSSRRLGKTDDLITSANFFREQLAVDLGSDTCPMIALEGVVVHEPSKRRAGDVKVYGVDERFWKFNGVAGVTSPENRNVLVSDSLAAELGSRAGESLVLRIEKPSDIPVESLHGRKEDPGRTIRLSVAGVLGGENLGEFSLQPQHGAVRAVFVSLRFLQQELEQSGRVNTILVARSAQQQQSITTLLKNKATLDDLGLKLRTVSNQQAISLETSSKIINEHITAAANEAAKSLSLRTVPVLSYLANSISSGDRSTPYSLVTALDDETLTRLDKFETAQPAHPPIILNDWIARDLNVKRGDTVSLEYYLWHENGRLETKKADFQLVAIIPITGLAADRDLVPEYPGITESEDMSAWDPPFPISLDRVRKVDEDYWHQYKATPKAFIPLSTAQTLWGTRFGKLTSIRVESSTGQLTPETVNNYGESLRKSLDPALIGFQVVPVRDQGQAASRGATDFGEYFLYFSFFLVVAALMLTSLFFKLGIEQRAREIGTLQAIGFSDARIRRLFFIEGTLLAGIGSLLGLAGAIGYAALLMYGLRTWWVGAVGTTALTLHVSWVSLVIGVVGGVAAALVCIYFTLRRLGRSSTRSLLMGFVEEGPKKRRKSFFGAFASSRETLLNFLFTALGLALLIVGALAWIPRVAAFFGGGVVLLIAGVLFLSSWLKRTKKPLIQGSGWWTIARLGFRNATYRPGRTVLCITLIASAAFIIVAVDAFRRSGTAATDRKSGTGGFPFVAESLLPVVHDANTPEGRESLNLGNDPTLKDVHFVNLRVRPGDDTSCLNLYQPRNPKIVAPPPSFINDNRFTFQSSIAATADEQNNPWLLLDRQLNDGVVPVIGDANSLTYVLHLKVGDELVVDHVNGPLRLRVVAALSDSIFQSELLMSEKNFLKLFPAEAGYRMFLIDVPNKDQAVSTLLEERLSDFGFDVSGTDERLANFHRVENTYLSTFQLLGGLGLALGTFGMAAVLLRNVFERRRELALLRAVGYNSSHFAAMVITENVLMLCCGLAVGFVCALLAITPVFFERGGRLPNISLGLLLLAVLLSGAFASLVATLAALRSPLLPALRSE